MATKMVIYGTNNGNKTIIITLKKIMVTQLLTTIEKQNNARLIHCRIGRMDWGCWPLPNSESRSQSVESSAFDCLNLKAKDLQISALLISNFLIFWPLFRWHYFHVSSPASTKICLASDHLLVYYMDSFVNFIV